MQRRTQNTFVLQNSNNSKSDNFLSNDLDNKLWNQLIFNCKLLINIYIFSIH